MLDQTFIDTVIVLGMFVLRVGVPIAILYVLARWLGKKLQPQEMSSARQRDGKIIPFAKPSANAAATQANDAPKRMAG